MNANSEVERKKYLFICPKCKTVLTIETHISEDRVNRGPSCVCGGGTMISMSSPEYAYGNLK